MLHLSLNTENKTKQKKTTDACWLQPTFVVKENGWAWRGVCQLLTYHCMVWCAEVNLPIPATASFVLGREHVVHKAETNPPEYHQLYTTYASRLAHNTHSKKNNTFLLEHKTRIAARAPIPIIFKPLMRIVMILSPGCVCIHLFLAVRWVHWFTGLVLLAHCQKVLRYKYLDLSVVLHGLPFSPFLRVEFKLPPVSSHHPKTRLVVAVGLAHVAGLRREFVPWVMNNGCVQVMQCQKHRSATHIPDRGLLLDHKHREKWDVWMF